MKRARAAPNLVVAHLAGLNGQAVLQDAQVHTTGPRGAFVNPLGWLSLTGAAPNQERRSPRTGQHGGQSGKRDQLATAGRLGPQEQLCQTPLGTKTIEDATRVALGLSCAGGSAGEVQSP